MSSSASVAPRPHSAIGGRARSGSGSITRVAATARSKNARSASGRRSEVLWLEYRPSISRLTPRRRVLASLACSTR